MIDFSKLHPEYLANLERGREFQDFAMLTLFKECGIVVPVFASLKYQVKYGESLCRCEIKLDTKFFRTKRLFIETEERPTLDSELRPSGLDDPKCKFYLVGDYETFWFFGCHTLRNARSRHKHDGSGWELAEHKIEYEGKLITLTKGALLPIEEADDLAEIKWEKT